MSVAVGDFNGDGMLDIATVNDDDRGFVAILLGNGDGTFQAPITYPVGTDPVFVAVGDFNGDGNLDLAVANSNSNNISVHLGNGDGTFQNPIFIPTGAAPGSIAIGDFNRDGQLDLAVANANSNNISILLGNGDGTFQAQVTHSSGLDPISIQVGDLNGDGNPDLVVANSWSNNLTVLLGNGDGTFGASQFYATDAGPLSVAIGDFNHDGIADLVTANFYGGDVSVLLGYGDGTFRTEMPYATAPQTASVSVADLNGDGSLDIVAGSTAGGELSIVLGAGDGTFHGAIQYAENSGPDSLDSIAVGDFDGDGQIDIASAFGPSVRVFLSEQVATFGLNEISVPGTGSQSVVALYSGDDCRSGSQSNIITLTGLASSTITLTSSQPSLVMGQTAILTAKVSSGATGFVSFTAAGVSLGTIAVDGTGTAVLSTQFTGLSPNSYSVTASYSGDSNFAPASTSVTETLSLANSVTVLTSSSDPSSYGSLVTFTATTNLGATGVVTFLDGTTTIGTATPKAGVATLSTNSLSVGKHSVEAIYAGDGNYSGSTSPVVTQLVNRAAVTLTLTSSANPSLYGNTLTFTATAPSGVTGTVTFADGVVMLGKANLDVSGRAVVSIATLPAGTHNIIATYSGDSNYF
ncbi:MAG: FG-GAP-like repeat-containing protein [Edaphobacter sp.]